MSPLISTCTTEALRSAKLGNEQACVMQLQPDDTESRQGGQAGVLQQLQFANMVDHLLEVLGTCCLVRTCCVVPVGDLDQAFSDQFY